MISIITTCKNRLSFLQKTLPLMHKQSNCEVIVVDYCCEQGTADWVERNHPASKVVRVTDDPRSSLSRARNIGAENAAGEFLFFLDADVIVNGDIGRTASSLHEDSFYMRQALAIGELYRRVKSDMQRLLRRDLGLVERQKLFQQISDANRNAVTIGLKEMSISIPVPGNGRPNRFSQSICSLVYKQPTVR